MDLSSAVLIRLGLLIVFVFALGFGARHFGASKQHQVQVVTECKQTNEQQNVVSNTGVGPASSSKVETSDAGGSKICTWQFVKYTSSALESKWVKNAAEWGFKVCPYQVQDQALFDTWVPQVIAYEQAPSDQLPKMSDLFSRITYRDVCSGKEVDVPIEPFAGTGRHPNFCSQNKDGVNKDYMLVERTLPQYRKAFFLDLGASLWSSGSGGASQSWFYEMYKKRGIKFDGFYAWEVSEHKPADVFAQIPGDVRAIYHWLNIPADPTPGADGNPFTMLKQVARPEDFVVIKIDIDNSKVELPFIDQILTDKSISSLIDELYFEHHYNMQPLTVGGWGTSGSESGQTMVDSAKIFLGLRQLGIRAHVWV
jgi:hypothetical protein